MQSSNVSSAQSVLQAWRTVERKMSLVWNCASFQRLRSVLLPKFSNKSSVFRSKFARRYVRRIAA